MSRGPERQPGGLWRPDIVRAVLSGHSIAGLAFAALIYLVCLTGTLAVFTRDLQRWEQPDAPAMQVAGPDAIARAIGAMGARTDPAATIYVNLPGDGAPRLVLSSGGGAVEEVWLADRSGRLAVRQQDPWTDFLADLHTELHLPKRWGRFLVGLAGVALLSSLVSGVLAHPRIFRDAFHLRLGGARRLQEADLHNRLGVWAMPFHLTVALTGALLGLSTIIVGVLALLLFRGDSAKVYELLAPPAAKPDLRPAPMPDVAALLARARALAPAASPRMLTVQHWNRRDMRLEITAARPALVAQQDSVTFDARGAVVAQKHPADQTLGARILGSLGPLHFGWFGGVTIRVAYGLLGLALCVVTSSGVSVWLARRRDKGRPAPGWERVWAAVVWGQPVILAALALATLVPGRPLAADALPPCWAVLSVAGLALAALARRSARRQVDGVLRAILGGELAATALIHLLVRPRALADPASLLIDVALLASAAVLIRSARHGAAEAARG